LTYEVRRAIICLFFLGKLLKEAEMTLQGLSSEKCCLSSAIETVSLDLGTFLEAIGKADPPVEPPIEIDRRKVCHEERQQVLASCLKRVASLSLPGKEEVSAYLRDQNRRGLQPSTTRGTLITIEGFLSFLSSRGRTDLGQLVREDLEAYIEHEQDRGIRASTVSMRLGFLKAFLRFLIEQGSVREDVISKRLRIKVPDALPRAMAPEDIDKLLRVLDHPRDRALVVVLLRTGMRVGELLNTLVSDLHLEERRIDIYEGDKNRVGRVVYLSDDALSALRQWLKRRKLNRSYLFYGQRYKPISYTAARMIFLKYLRRAGLTDKGYTLHSLRHTCATELLNAGMRLECLQPLLGHSSLEMTRRYARLSDKTREEEYFRAMAIIEKGQSDEHHRFDPELPQAPQTAKLLGSHRQELHEHP
jgi:site-specific recombinase XerD